GLKEGHPGVSQITSRDARGVASVSVVRLSSRNSLSILAKPDASSICLCSLSRRPFVYGCLRRRHLARVLVGSRSVTKVSSAELRLQSAFVARIVWRAIWTFDACDSWARRLPASVFDVGICPN